MDQDGPCRLNVLDQRDTVEECLVFRCEHVQLCFDELCVVQRSAQNLHSPLMHWQLLRASPHDRPGVSLRLQPVAKWRFHSSLVPHLFLALMNPNSCLGPQRLLDKTMDLACSLWRCNCVDVVQECQQIPLHATGTEPSAMPGVGLMRTTRASLRRPVLHLHPAKRCEPCQLHLPTNNLRDAHKTWTRTVMPIPEQCASSHPTWPDGAYSVDGSHSGARIQLGQALQSVSNALASTLRRQRVLERCCGVQDFGHQLL